MLVWMTSLDCATCCLVDVMAATTCACPSDVRPACCAVAAEASDGATLSVQGRGGPTCPMLPTSYGDAESARKDDPIDQPAFAPEPIFVPAECQSAVPSRVPATVDNRGDTYLRCCVLLI